MPLTERDERAATSPDTRFRPLRTLDERRPDATAPHRVVERPAHGRMLPLREFVHNEASGAILLLACALVALVWANSLWADAYTDLWQTRLTVGIGRFHITESLQHWINDGLMAVFFFVVGLEIKREILVGELASPRRAALPVIAAVGGVLVPAGIYAVLNVGTAGSAGWGVPMATDIAFALGVLALIGDRIPIALKVFLTALAIVDDIAAVLVIALFYTGAISWSALGMAGLLLTLLVGANRRHVRHPLVYLLVGVGLWVALFESGVHATVAGVLLALTIPARTRPTPGAFRDGNHASPDKFEETGVLRAGGVLTNGARRRRQHRRDRPPGLLQELEHVLHPWVAFIIVPLFALANAGVSIEGDLGMAFGNRVTLGIILGLIVGKQVGITLFAYLATRAGATALPAGVTWSQVYGVSWLAGIGFTMSLFITDLAFGTAGEAALVTSAKLGILTASLLAGVVGWRILARANQDRAASPR